MSIENKHLVTGALLAFVVVTVVTLAVKETRHARAVAAVEATDAVPPSPALLDGRRPPSSHLPPAACRA
ncbi:MAG: hypothetical protein IPF66_00375 [Holophagales bacterium]|nr:hypothetical protein [Holophagales bacterium]